MTCLNEEGSPYVVVEVDKNHYQLKLRGTDEVIDDIRINPETHEEHHDMTFHINRYRADRAVLAKLAKALLDRFGKQEGDANDPDKVSNR